MTKAKWNSRILWKKRGDRKRILSVQNDVSYMLFLVLIIAQYLFSLSNPRRWVVFSHSQQVDFSLTDTITGIFRLCDSDSVSAINRKGKESWLSPLQKKDEYLQSVPIPSGRYNKNQCRCVSKNYPRNTKIPTRKHLGPTKYPGRYDRTVVVDPRWHATHEI